MSAIADSPTSDHGSRVDSGRKLCKLRARFVRAIQMEMASSREENRLRRRGARLRRDGIDRVLVAARVEMGLWTDRFLCTHYGVRIQDGYQHDNWEAMHMVYLLRSLRIPCRRLTPADIRACS